MKLRRVGRQIKKYLFLEIGYIDKLPKILILMLVGVVLFGVLSFIRELITDSQTRDALGQILLGLIPEFLGSAAVYWVLDSSIQQLYGISELPELPLANFIKDIAQARQIRILETFTSLVTSDRYDKFAQAITAAIRNQEAEVQMLMIHPDSDGAKQRAEELAEVLNVVDEIQTTLARLYEIQESLPKTSTNGRDRLTIKLYNASPAIAMHQWDSNAYVSFYPVGQRADDAPNLKVSLKTTFGRFVTHKFDELWNQEGSISLDEHMLLTVLLDDDQKRRTYAVQIRDFQTIAFYASCNFGDTFGDFMKAKSSGEEPLRIIADGRPHLAKCSRVSDPSEKQFSIEQIKAKYGWDDERVNKEINLDPVVYLLELHHN